MSSVTLPDITNSLRQQVRARNYIDVGKGAEKLFDISRPKFNAALDALLDEGYRIYRVRAAMLGTSNYTILKVLTNAEVTFAETRAAVLQGKLFKITD